MSRSRSLQFYILSRLALAPLMLWLVTTIVFLLLRALPGDPVDAILGTKASADAKAALREQLGLNESILHQYFDYLWQLLHLDLGTSLTSRGQTVTQIIHDFFPATAELAIVSLGIAFVVGTSIGILSATQPNSPWDLGGRLFGILTYAVPPFWAGMVLQLIFAVKLRWFPIGTRFPIGTTSPVGPTGLYLVDSLLTLNGEQFRIALYYLILPSLTLGILLSGIFERIVRINLRQSLQADYVEAAQARGIPQSQIVLNHALKNAMIPVITILGLTLAALLGGALLTEVTFSWPGLANRLYEAISARDYTTVQGIIVFFAAIVVFASIAIDILTAYIDPRIRY
ncbi:MAG: ABC transporter permease [Prochlorotrichaceae cyanobacterium]|jgi:peptide/nickel transport system permease protein